MSNLRRSGRERKRVDYAQTSTLKRKHASDNEDSGHDEELSDAFSDEEDAYQGKKMKSATATRQTKPKAAKRPTKRARTTKLTKSSDKPKDAPTNQSTASHISHDNPLFNAVLNPSTALQSTVEDFLQSLEFTPNSALAELINFLLRACGSNDSVDSDQVVDSDGVVDVLDHFTEALKHIDSPMYPLTSKLPVFKKFRKSLCEFLDRLVNSSAEMGVLYNAEFMGVLKEWITSMSSSQIRSFRHTATVVVLELQTALCRVAASLEKEADRVGRQREGDKKRKGTSKGGGVKGKDLEDKADQLRVRRAYVAGLLKEFFTGVFIHRYRDTDYLIRADCVRSLGQWFERFPSEFLNGTYMRYVGWVLSDPSAMVRMEAVKALNGVYSQSDYTHGLNHFTERFKPRLIQMAKGDTDLHIRVAVIQVLNAIDDQSLLDDEEREELCTLIVDTEPKVRQAVGPFVKNVWEETLETKLTGITKVTQRDQDRVGCKVLATFLVNLCKNQLGSANNETRDAAGSEQDDAQPSALFQLERQSRPTLMIQSLWSDLDILHDWEGLLDLLLRDHSAAEGGVTLSSPKKGRHGNWQKGESKEAIIDELSRLSDDEESFLLEAVHTVFSLAKEEAAGGKKDEEEKTTNEISRALIKALPRLFVKHQTDEKRIEYVLRLPNIMNLDMYLDMRMLANYTSLWDDIMKQFLSHSSMPVLHQAMGTMVRCLGATSLAKTNSEKILELEEELSASLRDITGGRDDLDVTSFTEDEMLALTSATARISVLCASRDMCDWIMEDEGGKQSSAWDIIFALADRGRLGHKDEELLYRYTTQILTSHILWTYSRLLPELADSGNEETSLQESFIGQRDILLDKLIDFALGGQSNCTEQVKLMAFRHCLDLEILFGAAEPHLLQLVLDDETQYRCAGFMQAKIERYADELYSRLAAHAVDEEDEDEDDADSNIDLDLDTWSPTDLAIEYSFMEVVFTFIRCLFSGIIHPRHGAIFLPYFGRLGPQYDQCCKRILNLIRDDALKDNHPESLVESLAQAMQEAFHFTLAHKLSDDCLSHLAKLLGSSFTLRGFHLTIVKKLSSSHIADIHLTILSWLCNQLEKASSKEAPVRRLAKFFQFLIPLVHGLDSKDALAIKARLNQLLAEKKLYPSSSNEWEGLRSYEKRLATALTKEKVTKKRRKKSPKHDGATTSEEESDLEQRSDAETQPPPPRPPVANGQQLPEEDAVPMPHEEEDDHPSSTSFDPPESSPLKRTRSESLDSPSEAQPSPPANGENELIIKKRRRIRY